MLESSYQPNLFIRSRKKNACPRPNAVDNSLIYKGDADAPMQNQQSSSNTRFPHGTEVRFDCLRTELEEDVSVEEEIIDGEEDTVDEYEEQEADEEVYNFRKKRAVRSKINKRKKPRKQKPGSRGGRRGPQTVDGDDKRNQNNAYGIQVDQGESIEDMLKKVKYRSWKIVCNDGKWIGKSLGCDENGKPLLEDEATGVDFNPFNASCPYVKSPGDNIVAFHGDREITAEGFLGGIETHYKEYFEPGAELVYRCKDIGNATIYFSGYIHIFTIIIYKYIKINKIVNKL